MDSPANDDLTPVADPWVEVHLHPYDLLIFDLDHTLVKLNVQWRVVKARLGNLYGERHGHARNFTPLTIVLEHIRERFGEAELQRFRDVIVEAEREAVGTVAEPLPRALAFLRRAKREEGKHTAIFSMNFSRTIREVARAFEFDDLVDYAVGQDDVIHTKPDPEGLEKILAHFGVSPAEAIYFGDLPADVEAGRRAGITTVLVPRDKPFHKPSWWKDAENGLKSAGKGE